MDYLYYPGCSLEGTSKEYDISTRAFMAWAGATLHEIEDWTCCGASAAENVSGLLGHALGARNLALAGRMAVCDQILVPCSACYLNLKKAGQVCDQDAGLRSKVNEALAQERFEYVPGVRVRHLLDVLVNDMDIGRLTEEAHGRLSGMVAAPYYGCQCLRPYAVFDDPEDPRSMEPLIRATGASPLDWDMAGDCCGASHTTTKPDAGLALVEKILVSAQKADLILTVCPMCQMNLEAYQDKVSKPSGKDLHIPVLFLPQFLGLALGLDPNDLGLNFNLSKVEGVLEKI